jgi:hypothetical protein
MASTKGLSKRIREVAQRKYVEPAMQTGKVDFSIRVRDLMDDLRSEGTPVGQNTPQFCTSIQKSSFLEANQLEITGVDGPPSKLSTTVVVHYRFAGEARDKTSNGSIANVPETPAERAFRLTEKLRGLMKDEIAAHGGTEGFIRWVRSDEDAA